MILIAILLYLVTIIFNYALTVEIVMPDRKDKWVIAFLSIIWPLMWAFIFVGALCFYIGETIEQWLRN